MAELASVNTFAGRYYLSVAGVVVAMQGDPCRDNELPEEVLDPIPQDELERATIGEKRASELPMQLVRFFRGDRWTPKMLEYVAEKVNSVAATRSDLARKVLEVVEGERLYENLDNEGDKGYTQALDNVTAALRELFQKEGVIDS